MNEGEIRVSDGGGLGFSVDATWVNRGLITLTSARFGYHGAASLSQFGNFQASPDSWFDLSDVTLDLDGQTFDIAHPFGGYLYGSLKAADVSHGTLLSSSAYPATFERGSIHDCSLGGNVLADRRTTIERVSLVADGVMLGQATIGEGFVQNGHTLHDGGGQKTFTADTTLDGPYLGQAWFNVTSGAMLTVGPQAHLSDGAFILNLGEGGTFHNLGVIDASYTGGGRRGSGGGSFVNDGTIAITDVSQLILATRDASAPDTTVSLNRGSIVLDHPSARLALGGEWWNEGSIEIRDGSLEIWSPPADGAYGTITRSPDAKVWLGSMDLGGATLDLSAGLGSVSTVYLASVSHGTIAGSGVETIETDDHTTLEDMSLRNVSVLFDEDPRLAGRVTMVGGTMAPLTPYSYLGALKVRTWSDASLLITYETAPRERGVLFDPFLDAQGLGSNLTIEPGSTITASGVSFATHAGGEIVNRGTIRIDRSEVASDRAVAQISGDGLFTNEGRIDIGGSDGRPGALDVADSVSFGSMSGSTLERGDWIVRDHGVLTFGSRVVDTLSTNVTLTGSTARFDPLSSLALVTPEGHLALEDGASLTLADSLVLDGTVSLGPNTLLDIPGQLEVEVGGTLAITLDGPISRAERIEGGAVHAASGAFLSGTFAVSFARGFTPDIGTTWIFLTASAIRGEFSSAVVGEPSDGRAVALRYADSSVTLKIVPSPGSVTLLLAGAGMAIRRRVRRA